MNLNLLQEVDYVGVLVRVPDWLNVSSCWFSGFDPDSGDVRAKSFQRLHGRFFLGGGAEFDLNFL